MKTHAKDIAAAQQNLLKTRALLDVFTAELASDFPAPDKDCNDETFDAWNEAYEQANLDRGGFKIQDAKTAAEDVLLSAFGAWIRSLKSPSPALIEVLDLAGKRYTVRVKLLDMAMKLDTRTLWMVS
jgi:hypothetical protein